MGEPLHSNSPKAADHFKTHWQQHLHAGCPQMSGKKNHQDWSSERPRRPAFSLKWLLCSCPVQALHGKPDQKCVHACTHFFATTPTKSARLQTDPSLVLSSVIIVVLSQLAGSIVLLRKDMTPLIRTLSSLSNTLTHTCRVGCSEWAAVLAGRLRAETFTRLSELCCRLQQSFIGSTSASSSPAAKSFNVWRASCETTFSPWGGPGLEATSAWMKEWMKAVEMRRPAELLSFSFWEDKLSAFHSKRWRLM